MPGAPDHGAGLPVTSGRLVAGRALRSNDLYEVRRGLSDRDIRAHTGGIATLGNIDYIPSVVLMINVEFNR